MIVPIVSIPKSGTYYLNEMMHQLLPERFGYAFSKHYHSIETGSDVERAHREIKRLSYSGRFDNFCYLGHWKCTPHAVTALSSYRPIFIYRHPLDIATSFVESADRGLFYDDVVRYFKHISLKENRYMFLLREYGANSHPWLKGFRQLLLERGLLGYAIL